MAALLKDALKPNLVQTLEHTPALIHGGPFANIAHGCNSVLATRMALKLGDYAVTEAGFGADLGAEKFLDIKCRMAGLRPAAVVVVATVRGAEAARRPEKGGTEKRRPRGAGKGSAEPAAPRIQHHKRPTACPCVVAINRFPDDTEAELKLVEEKCRALGVNVALSEVWSKGGEGGVALARKWCASARRRTASSTATTLSMTIEEKLNAIARRVYGGAGAEMLPAAKKAGRASSRNWALAALPVCVAKTQYSFSDDPQKAGARRRTSPSPCATCASRRARASSSPSPATS